MRPPNANEHFDHLTTSWTLLRNAHNPEAADKQRQAARQQLLERYRGVATRYLAGALRRESDRERAVNECLSDFSLRVMSGAFKGAAAERGRFRNFLRRCLSNLVHDYGRQRRHRFQPLGDLEPVASGPPPVSDEEYVKLWREDLVSRALRALEALQQSAAHPLYAVLRLKMDHPDLRSAERAERLSASLGRALTASRARQLLSEARERFAQCLLEEVRQSLDEPTDEQLGEELAELGLLEACRAALEKKRPRS